VQYRAGFFSSGSFRYKSPQNMGLHPPKEDEMRRQRAPGLKNVISIPKLFIFTVVFLICFPPNPALAGNEKTVALVMKALTNPFFSRMELGAKAFAQQEQIPLEVFGVERETDVERQISIVKNLISRGYGAIVIAPADSKALVPVCQKALQEKIVVVNIDNPLHRETMAQFGITIPFVGPDNRAGAATIGDYLKRRLGGRGRVIVIEGIRGVENAEHRKAGFVEAVTRESDVEIVASESANWHTDEALSLSIRLLEQYGPVDAVFSANDKMALGALQALDISGSAGKVLLAGYDNIEAVQREMESGRVHATVEQHPEMMGAFGVELAARALNGEHIPQFIATPFDLVTHETFNKRVALSISNLQNPFFAVLHKEAEATAGLHGMTFTVHDARNDDAQQLTDLMAILNDEVDALIVNPTNTETVGPGIELANKKGIPVVTVDRKAAEGRVICHIESDNARGGQMAAEVLARLLGGRGKIIELEGIPGTSATQERGAGFNNTLRGYPDIQVVARVVADFERRKAAGIMRRLLREHPKIDGVFAHNDNMILGALDALGDQGVGKAPVLVGFDGIREARGALREGRLAATIVQKPEKMGALAVESLVRLYRGEKPTPRILVDLELAER
jgi:ABC-type sugar transport system substrate-binding protein